MTVASGGSPDLPTARTPLPGTQLAMSPEQSDADRFRRLFDANLEDLWRFAHRRCDSADDAATSHPRYSRLHGVAATNCPTRGFGSGCSASPAALSPIIAAPHTVNMHPLTPVSEVPDRSGRSNSHERGASHRPPGASAMRARVGRVLCARPPAGGRTRLSPAIRPPEGSRPEHARPTFGIAVEPAVQDATRGATRAGLSSTQLGRSAAVATARRTRYRPRIIGCSWHPPRRFEDGSDRPRLRGIGTRFLCEPVLSRPSWRAVLRAAGVGQGGAPAAKRGRTTLTNPRAGADWLWAG